MDLPGTSAILLPLAGFSMLLNLGQWQPPLICTLQADNTSTRGKMAIKIFLRIYTSLKLRLYLLSCSVNTYITPVFKFNYIQPQ